MRPRIEGKLEELIEEAADESSFDNPGEFIRDAARRRAEEILNDHD